MPGSSSPWDAIPPYKHPTRKSQAGIPGNDSEEEGSPLKAHQLTDAVLENLWLWYFCDRCRSFGSSLELLNSRFWVSAVSVKEGTDDSIDLTVQENGHCRFQFVAKKLTTSDIFVGLELQSNSDEIANGASPPSKRTRLAASLEHSSTADKPTFVDFKDRIFTTMREQVLNLYGPEQQFDPYELYGKCDSLVVCFLLVSLVFSAVNPQAFVNIFKRLMLAKEPTSLQRTPWRFVCKILLSIGCGTIIPFRQS
jgi:hypothetical protein